LAFPALLTLGSLEKQGKHGNSRFSWKGRTFLPRQARKARKVLLLSRKAWIFPEKPGKPGMTVPGVEFLAFMEKQEMPTHGKPRKPEQNPGFPEKLGILD